MILQNIDSFEQHVKVNSAFDFDTIEPYVKKQERKHLMPVIGRILYRQWSEEAPSTGTAKEVYELLQEASANLAMFAYTKVAIISITNTGLMVSESDHTKQAEWWQIRDLRRELMQSGMEAIDEALVLMEENKAEFLEWTSSTGYTSFQEFFVRSTQTFQRYFNIENSRLTFLRLKPHLLKVEDKYFRGLLGAETVDHIKAAGNAVVQEALEICQAAQVSFCVAEVAREGAFQFTSKGMFYEIDEIPGEKKTRLESAELQQIYQHKLEDGHQLLERLLQHLRAHPSDFPAFAEREADSLPSPVHNTKSILSL